MSPPLEQSAPPGRGQTGQNFESVTNTATRRSEPQDAFAEINSRTIPELWAMLGLPGEPKPNGSRRSPFRDEKRPSFSIKDGFHWKDFGTGEGGDGVAFVMAALRCTPAEAREWWLERDGIGPVDRFSPPRGPAKAPEPPKTIRWPGELREGKVATWAAFAERRGLSYRSVEVMVRADNLRFLMVDGVKCYAITDRANRAAEIRRIDGRLFGELKAYPLPGVDKRWLPGLANMAQAPAEAGILITEGATDLLAAFDLYTRYRMGGGRRSWIPAALLGASCKTLAPEAIPFVRGRRVRLVPDGDDKGDEMAKHWRNLLLGLGCTVDVVKLPRGRDLSDMKSEIQPEELFEIR